MRIGHGYDVHAFGDGDFVTLGGIKVPHHRGLLAHSDGDVALHALTDALLGAAALGDIGRHFPDTDAQFKGIDSRILLRKVVEQLLERGYTCNNADLTIVAQKPKLAAHVENMAAVIAKDLLVSADRVNVKATTSEWLGFTGREEGISCYAVVTLNEAPG